MREAPRPADSRGRSIDEADQPGPGEQPSLQQPPTLDEAPVPPLTGPEDTEGG